MYVCMYVTKIIKEKEAMRKREWEDLEEKEEGDDTSTVHIYEM